LKAIITGAGRGGIGGAISLRLAREARRRGEKAKLVLCGSGRRIEETEALADEVRAEGALVALMCGDLANPSLPGKIIEEALEFCGGLDLVVSNAGLPASAPLAEISLESWETLFAVHTRAAWLLARSAYPALKQSRGCFIATGSVSGTVPHPMNGAYCAAKAALIMLCETLALEWGPDGIRVNVVSPGSVKTPITQPYFTDPEVMSSRQAEIPLGRVAEADEIGAVVSFLAGPGASFITGQNIVVDGGVSRISLDRIRSAGSGPKQATT